MHHIAVHANANCDPRQPDTSVDSNPPDALTKIRFAVSGTRGGAAGVGGCGGGAADVVGARRTVSPALSPPLPLTGSDVAILTVEVFCPFCAPASLSDHSHSYGSRLSPRWGE